MPALTESLTEPRWAQFAAPLPVHPEVDPTHQLGGYCCCIPGRVIFAQVIAALAYEVSYERIASPAAPPAPSAAQAWTRRMVQAELHALVLARYDHRMAHAIHNPANAVSLLPRAPSARTNQC